MWQQRGCGGATRYTPLKAAPCATVQSPALTQNAHPFFFVREAEQQLTLLSMIARLISPLLPHCYCPSPSADGWTAQATGTPHGTASPAPLVSALFVPLVSLSLRSRCNKTLPAVRTLPLFFTPHLIPPPALYILLPSALLLGSAHTLPSQHHQPSRPCITETAVSHHSLTDPLPPQHSSTLNQSYNSFSSSNASILQS